MGSVEMAVTAAAQRPLPMSYQPRIYRKDSTSPDLVGFGVCVAQTDLYIQAETDLTDEVLAAVRDARQEIETHIALRPEFATALRPLAPPSHATELMRAMYQASQRAGVGPMAAVAGAIAEFVGRRLLARSHQVIVENGGDIFLATHVPRVVAIHAGRSPLTGRLGLSIPGDQTLGVCTSSGSIGPSLSTGQAQAAVVVADDTAFADAAATAIGNRVKGIEDCAAALDWVKRLEGVRGAVVIYEETLAVWGEFELQLLASGGPPYS